MTNTLPPVSQGLGRFSLWLLCAALAGCADGAGGGGADVAVDAEVAGTPDAAAEVVAQPGAPNVVLLGPDADSVWKVGQTIPVSARVTDPGDPVTSLTYVLRAAGVGVLAEGGLGGTLLELGVDSLSQGAHVLTLEARELFDQLDLRRPAARAAQLARDAASQAIGLVLDDFHDAAAKADEERYFAHFAPGAVFLGTDPAERWTVEEFKEWSRPYFERETAWTYTAGRRTVGVSPDGNAAWFDEDLQNAKLGHCRGTGALIRTDRGWRITQYNLTVPVPNDLMGKVVEMMRAGGGQ